MTVRISRALLDRLLAEAAASPDAEICGLLLGDRGIIEDILPTANVATDPRHAFEVDPRALIDQIRRERAGGLPQIGHYHSHPNGRTEPSPRDAEACFDDRLWLILAGKSATVWRGGAASGLHGCFAPLLLLVTS